MEQIPRIATSGKFSTGVKLSIPIDPRFVTVNVAPINSSGLIFPSTHELASRFASFDSSGRLSLLAFF